jgi:ankyrin repeat protein
MEFSWDRWGRSCGSSGSVGSGSSGGSEAEQWPEHRVDAVLVDSAHGRWDRVSQALDAGFPVNARGGWLGASVLHFAARLGHVPVMRRLLAAGAHVNIRDSGEQTPMHFGVQHVDGLAALVEEGADVNARDSRQYPPLFGAVLGTLPSTLYLLSLPQVDLSATDTHGRTAEDLARDYSRFDSAKAVRAEVRASCNKLQPPPPF